MVVQRWQMVVMLRLSLVTAVEVTNNHLEHLNHRILLCVATSSEFGNTRVSFLGTYSR